MRKIIAVFLILFQVSSVTFPPASNAFLLGEATIVPTPDLDGIEGEATEAARDVLPVVPSFTFPGDLPRIVPTKLFMKQWREEWPKEHDLEEQLILEKIKYAYEYWVSQGQIYGAMRNLIIFRTGYQFRFKKVGHIHLRKRKPGSALFFLYNANLNQFILAGMDSHEDEKYFYDRKTYEGGVLLETLGALTEEEAPQFLDPEGFNTINQVRLRSGEPLSDYITRSLYYGIEEDEEEPVTQDPILREQWEFVSGDHLQAALVEAMRYKEEWPLEASLDILVGFVMGAIEPQLEGRFGSGNVLLEPIQERVKGKVAKILEQRRAKEDRKKVRFRESFEFDEGVRIAEGDPDNVEKLREKIETLFSKIETGLQLLGDWELVSKRETDLLADRISDWRKKGGNFDKFLNSGSKRNGSLALGELEPINLRIKGKVDQISAIKRKHRFELTSRIEKIERKLEKINIPTRLRSFAGRVKSSIPDLLEEISEIAKIPEDWDDYEDSFEFQERKKDLEYRIESLEFFAEMNDEIIALRLNWKISGLGRLNEREIWKPLLKVRQDEVSDSAIRKAYQEFLKLKRRIEEKREKLEEKAERFVEEGVGVLVDELESLKQSLREEIEAIPDEFFLEVKKIATAFETNVWGGYIRLLKEQLEGRVQIPKDWDVTEPESLTAYERATGISLKDAISRSIGSHVSRGTTRRAVARVLSDDVGLIMQYRFSQIVKKGKKDLLRILDNIPTLSMEDVRPFIETEQTDEKDFRETPRKINEALFILRGFIARKTKGQLFGSLLGLAETEEDSSKKDADGLEKFRQKTRQIDDSLKAVVFAIYYIRYEISDYYRKRHIETREKVNKLPQKGSKSRTLTRIDQAGRRIFKDLNPEEKGDGLSFEEFKRRLKRKGVNIDVDEAVSVNLDWSVSSKVTFILWMTIMLRYLSEKNVVAFIDQREHARWAVGIARMITKSFTTQFWLERWEDLAERARSLFSSDQEKEVQKEILFLSSV